MYKNSMPTILLSSSDVIIIETQYCGFVLEIYLII